MKVCPKCNSSYSDETLNFCLTDGVPLVVEEALEDFLTNDKSESWRNAKTLVDPRFRADGRLTAASSSAPTLELNKADTTDLTGRRSNKMFYVLSAILAATVLFGGVWWFNNSRAAGQNSAIVNNSPTSTPKRPTVELSPEQQAQVKKELTEFLESWRVTNERKDADAHIAHYANTLEIYYGESGKDRNHVLADRLRAYQRYDTILMQIDNIKLAPESIESATVVFDKTWTMKNAQKTSTGSVQQELHISKQNGKWLIDSEKDLKVYFLNNRENQTANTDQTPENPVNGNSK